VHIVFTAVNTQAIIMDNECNDPLIVSHRTP
jgi:hypothetical protein